MKLKPAFIVGVLVVAFLVTLHYSPHDDGPFELIAITTNSTPLVVFFAIALSTFVTEDLTCIGVGVLIADGRIGPAVGVVACLAGIFVGDVLLFLAGRYLGRAVLSRAPLRWFLSASAVEQCSRWFRRRGVIAIAASRFIPGTRLPTYFAAGLLDTNFWKFSLYFLLAAAVWTPLLVVGSMLAGRQIIGSLLLSQQSLMLKLAIGVGILFVVIRAALTVGSYRGRRLLIGKFRRVTRWEFWPAWFFYPPVIAYVLYLGIKHRNFTLFTCVNPGIEESGFIGESKFAILSRLRRNSSEFVPATGLLSRPGSGLREAQQFMIQHRLNYPIVLKPNSGERGSGVSVINSDDDAVEYFNRTSGDVIIQEYAPGLEFGVFYYRYPNHAAGKIFSITRKLFPTIVGDGVSTVEKLILADVRAVSMARAYFESQRDRLHEVLKAGETLQLIDVGTHCRGSIFLDGCESKTTLLEESIDRIAQSFDGFCFGRFDIRTPSLADFQKSRNFKIVELNGVTSEATNIYDPKNSLFTAYKILFEQWRIAFEIGAQNRLRGTEPASLKHLFYLILKNWRQRPERFEPELRLRKQEVI